MQSNMSGSLQYNRAIFRGGGGGGGGGVAGGAVKTPRLKAVVEKCYNSHDDSYSLYIGHNFVPEAIPPVRYNPVLYRISSNKHRVGIDAGSLL